MCYVICLHFFKLVFNSGSDQHNAEVKILLQREIEGSYKSEYTDVQIKCKFL